MPSLGKEGGKVRATILLVEDDPATSRMVSVWIGRKFGEQVDFKAVVSCEEAISLMLSIESLDLLITDWRFSSGSGDGVVVIGCALERFPDLEIVATSGDLIERFREEVEKKLGSDGLQRIIYLQKPVTPSGLLPVISGIFSSFTECST